MHQMKLLSLLYDSQYEIPYGQGRFKEMLSENSSKEELLQLKARIKKV
jgi:hypothetical protein